MTLRWNPLTVVNHNEWRLPRLLFHGAHALAGLPLGVARCWFHLPVPLVLAGCVVIAFTLKCLWIDWHRMSGQFLHLQFFGAHDPFDVASDLGLTIMGALLPSWRIALPVYYALSVVNGT